MRPRREVLYRGYWVAWLRGLGLKDLTILGFGSFEFESDHPLPFVFVERGDASVERHNQRAARAL